MAETQEADYSSLHEAACEFGSAVRRHRGQDLLGSRGEGGCAMQGVRVAAHYAVRAGAGGGVRTFAKRGYENDVITIVTKLLERNPSRSG